LILLNIIIMSFRIPTEKCLELMIEKEIEYRLSSEYIEKCNAVADVPNGWLDVSDKLQYQIANEFGFIGINAHIAVNHLRRARILFPNNQIMYQPVYVKHNKANKGINNVGDSVPNIEIYKSREETVFLHELLNVNNQKTILIGSSHT